MTDDWTPEFPGQRPPFRPGHQLSTRHGAYSARVVEPLAQQLIDEVLATCDADGMSWLKTPSFRPSLLAWARAESRVLLLTEWLGDKADPMNAGGLLDAEGEIRGAAEMLLRCEATAAKARSRLGLDPISRARLGRDSAAGQVDMARLMAMLAKDAGTHSDEAEDDDDDT